MYSRRNGHEALSSFRHVFSASTAGRFLDTVGEYPESDFIGLVETISRFTTQTLPRNTGCMSPSSATCIIQPTFFMVYCNSLRSEHEPCRPQTR